MVKHAMVVCVLYAPDQAVAVQQCNRLQVGLHNTSVAHVALREIHTAEPEARGM